MKNILVVGDWLVDEHWVTGVHRSSTSSRTGGAHYRALHSLESTVESFCGAGQTASLLYNIKENGDKYRYHIFGIGLWHKDDTEALEKMFDHTNLQGRTPYRITPKKTMKDVERVKLINLYEILKHDKKEQVCTTRILRIYDAASSDDVNFQRIDWELPLPGHEKKEMSGHHVLMDSAENIKTKMEIIFSKIDKKIDIIVIKDLCKGVVTGPLIRVLAKKYQAKEWYVSTKAWEPSWLEEIKNVNLKLLLIPQVAARAAITATSSEPISCWLTPSGKPDLMVYKKIDAILEKIKPTQTKKVDKPDPLVVVLPELYQVISYNPNINRNKQNAEIDLKTAITKPDETLNDCLIQAAKSSRKKIVPMAMASIFFPFIIDELHHRTGEFEKLTAAPMKKMIGEVIRSTHGWIKFEGERIRNPKSWDPTKGIFPLKDVELYTQDLHLDFIQSNWHYDKARWTQATNGIGVINTENLDKTKVANIELWRSMSEVKGYVCLDGTKRGELRKLTREVRDFAAKAIRHHTACMLVASPGSGKTYLVRQLAESMNLRSLNFNITQMSSRTDLIDCFDIITTQAHKKGEGAGCIHR